ncbi:MAG: hypothetical protein K6G65_09915 [Lachnospiraceae bacterium]|nr:hypothetical protein [Lachnospiraceae bacterium]
MKGIEMLGNEEVMYYIRELVQTGKMVCVIGGVCVLNLCFLVAMWIKMRGLWKRIENNRKAKNTEIKRFYKRLEGEFYCCRNVNNVDNFVDNCVNKVKIAGIHLYTVKNLCGQAWVLNLLTAVVVACAGVLLKCGQKWISVYILSGIGTGALIYYVDKILEPERNIMWLREKLTESCQRNVANDPERETDFNNRVSPADEEVKDQTKEPAMPSVLVKESEGGDEAGHAEKLIDDLLAEYFS